MAGIEILRELVLNRMLPAARNADPRITVWGQTDHPLKTDVIYPMPPYVREFYTHSRIIKFCYVVSGTCALMVGNQCYCLPAGSIGIVRRNRFSYEAYLTRSTPYMILWCALHAVDEVVIRLCRYRANNYELNIESFIIRVPVALSAKLENALEPAGNAIAVKAALADLSGYIAKSLTGEDRSGIRHTVRDLSAGRRQKQIVKDVLNLIQNRFKDKILLKDAAELSGLHPNYLDSLITQVTGSSFKRHLSHCRLKEAHKLLNKPHRNIAEIAYQCGFNDPYNFSRFFKRYTGISPKTFRDKYYGAL